MRLLLTRHGETEGNVRQVLADVDDPLTEKGREQARRLASRLKTERINAIYTSPLVRAKETASIIAGSHPEAAFFVEPALQEMALGGYLNKGFHDVDWEHMPADVESRTQMHARVEPFLRSLIERYPDKTVLLVAHNALNKAIIRLLRGLDPEDRQSIPQGNTALSIFEIDATARKEILFNCTAHLS